MMTLLIFQFWLSINMGATHKVKLLLIISTTTAAATSEGDISLPAAESAADFEQE